MIPISLRLRNFLSYGEGLEPLRFDGVHVACITGANGHGKSALLDAITWALWGECRARGRDDVIRTGASEVEVEFEFALDSGRYRVLRKRGRGTRGQASLDLHVVHDDGLRALTGTSISDTQQRIVELLGMRYDTFINSAFMVQGRADEFTVKPPNERKKILAEILELQRYDEYEARAREAMREREKAILVEDADLKRIDDELAARPTHEAEEQRLSRLLVERERAVEQAQAARRVLQERLNALRRARTEQQAVEARLADGRARLARADQTAAEHRKRLAAAERMLADADAIEASYQRLREARAALAAQGEKAARALQLQGERGRHERAIASARAALEATLGALDNRLANLQKAVTLRPKLEGQLAQAEEAAARFEALQAERARLNETLAARSAERMSLEATNNQLREQFKEAKEHRRVLGQADQCPYCLSPLSATSRQHAVSRCEQLYRDLEARGTANKARIAALGQEIEEARARLSEVEAEAAPLVKQTERVGALRQALAKATEEAAELAAHEDERQRAAAALAQDDYAVEARRALAALDEQLQALGFDQQAHAALKREVETLEPWEERYRLLTRARETAPRERELLEAAEADAAGWRARLADDEARAAELAEELASLPTLEAEAEAAEAATRQAEAALREAHQQLGAVRQQLAHLAWLAEERERTAERAEQLKRERGIYQELTHAFGKRGIQAMLIESAIPELEDEANALLARMTDNRMHLKLETQRDTQKGTTVETLDIKVADELGTRGYELFSGGEAFRANFALRVALARLVARRAGARLQLLIVDEGFGTQDAEGIERVVEAIKAIQDEFAKVLVVTHIAEMKEVFPVRIEVQKTRRGSVYQLA